jgi:hypothetical protein
VILSLLSCTLFADDALDTADTGPLYSDTQCEQPEGLEFTVPSKPNVMLVVDRSGSMTEKVCGDSGCFTRWESVMMMATYLGDVEAASNLGMALFSAPTGDSCTVEESIVVPVTDADNADELILSELHNTSPSGGTPTTEMIRHLVGDVGLQDPYRDNVVVLLTDGAPTCKCPAGQTSCERELAVSAVEELVSQEVPVKLHIIGFGTTSETQETLDRMGEAALATTPAGNVYTADSVEELLERLWAVAGSLQPCSFVLDTAVPAEDLVVIVNGAELAACASEDCPEGWTYDEDSATVHLAVGSCRELGGAECPDVRFETR